MIPVSDSFEVHGYFEEFVCAETYKFLGIRLLSEPGRALGSDGMVTLTITEPLQLLKGYKCVPITILASPEQPRRVIAMVQAICGKTKRTNE